MPEVLRVYEEHSWETIVKGSFVEPALQAPRFMFHTERKKEGIGFPRNFNLSEVNPRAKVFYQRACTNLYYDILGDWRNWKEATPIKNPSFRPIVMERIKRLLYWEKG
jgi:hypothetical protein